MALVEISNSKTISEAVILGFCLIALSYNNVLKN